MSPTTTLAPDATLSRPTAQEWDFSLSIKKSKEVGHNAFRWRDDTGDYYCASIAEGEWVVLDSRDEDSHLTVWCELNIVDGVATPSLPEGLSTNTPDEGEDLPPKLWRLCAVTPQNGERLAHPEGWWRLRAEGEPYMRYVAGYRGKMRVKWDDEGPHVHADHQAVRIDDENVAWFIGD